MCDSNTFMFVFLIVLTDEKKMFKIAKHWDCHVNVVIGSS